MAVIKLKEGNSYNTYTQTWLADTADELNGIVDRHQGDIGQLADGTTYCCNSSGNWVLQSSGGGGGTGDMSADVYDPYRNVAEADGIENYVSDYVAGSLADVQMLPLVTIITLDAESWDGGEQLVEISGMSEGDLIEVSPASMDDMKACADGEVWCTGYNDADAGLWFECGDNVPETDIEMVVVAFPGGR